MTCCRDLPDDFSTRSGSYVPVLEAWKEELQVIVEDAEDVAGGTFLLSLLPRIPPHGTRVGTMWVTAVRISFCPVAGILLRDNATGRKKKSNDTQAFGMA